jgi:hypothetical protein
MCTPSGAREEGGLHEAAIGRAELGEPLAAGGTATRRGGRIGRGRAVADADAEIVAGGLADPLAEGTAAAESTEGGATVAGDEATLAEEAGAGAMDDFDRSARTPSDATTHAAPTPAAGIHQAGRFLPTTAEASIETLLRSL